MSTIQNNNADLQAILDAVNALPDKVEAPTYKTCTLDIVNSRGYINRCVYCQLTPQGIPQYVEASLSDSDYNAYVEDAICGTLYYFYAPGTWGEDDPCNGAGIGDNSIIQQTEILYGAQPYFIGKIDDDADYASLQIVEF